MNFNDALKVVYEMDMFHSFKFAGEAELNGDKLFGLEYRVTFILAILQAHLLRSD